jgi:hypothetical protein
LGALLAAAEPDQRSSAERAAGTAPGEDQRAHPPILR